MQQESITRNTMRLPLLAVGWDSPPLTLPQTRGSPCHTDTSPLQCPTMLVCLPLLAAAEGISSDKALFGLTQFGDNLPPPPLISKPDEEFLAMGLEFVETREDIKVTELNELFEKVREACPVPALNVLSWQWRLRLARRHLVVWQRVEVQQQPAGHLHTCFDIGTDKRSATAH